MPFYDYKCNKCETFIERMFSITNIQKSVKCPDCGGRAKKSIETQNMQIQWNAGDKTPVFSDRKGDDIKKVGSRWYNKEIETTKAAVDGKSGVSPYSRMKINYDYFEKNGRAKKVSSKEAKVRREVSKRIVKDAVSKLSGAELDHTLRGSGRQG